MNGMFENGPIPPEALLADVYREGRIQRIGPTFQQIMGADGWGADFIDGELVRIYAPDGRRFALEVDGKDADLAAKAAAFREDMIERVARKGPEGEA